MGPASILRKSVLLVFAVCLVSESVLSQTPANEASSSFPPYLGKEPPGMTPKPLAPEVFLDGVHSAPAFSPAGTEVYWSRYYTPEGKRSRTQHIFCRRVENGKWTAPAVAEFSGEYSDGGPCFTKDGKRLFFYTNRPAVEGGQPSDEYVSDIWYVDRENGGWGEPQRLAFNTDQHEGMVSVAGDGTLYFTSNRTGVRGVFDIFVSMPVDGKYAKPRNIGAPITSSGIEFSPYVAPDQSYIVFTYQHRPEGTGLHVSFRSDGGSWGKPVRMKADVNVYSVQRFPTVSPDGKYFFFSRETRGDRQICWVDARVIEELRPRTEE